jgi:uncharacterized protein YndB with AHSA1/START domain
MLKKIVVVLVVVVAGFLAYASTRPDTLRVQRSATIKAPPDKIFPLITDLRRWSVWSPWEKKDPAMKRTFGGADSGQGAVYAWQGNSDVGEGRMEIVEATPPSKVAIQLDFIKPLEGHNVAEFTLKPKGDATDVTWVMYGPTPFIGKVLGIFMNMDAMIGKDFEAGLASLKAAAEK